MRPRATMSAGDSCSIAAPLKRIEPRKLLTIPEIVRLIVDFPAPLGPKTVTISPVCTAKFTPRRISVPPYPACTPVSESSGSGMHTPGGYAFCCASPEIGLDNERIGSNFLRCPLRDYPALGENEHVLGERGNCLHDMLRHQDCHATGGKLANDRDHVANLRRVQSGQYFIKQKQPRRDGQCAGELKPLAAGHRQRCGGFFELCAYTHRERNLIRRFERC